MTDTAQPKTVLETILEWSSTRPDWMRDALRRIVSGGTPSEGDLSELFNLCKKEHGDDTITLKAEPLDATHLPVDPGAGESVSIAAIKNVIGVNQLARDQKLAFETKGITIIYGPNGTGKSGYSRILKKACRARHAGEIMPDVYNPSPTGNATATLSVQKSDGSEQQIPWKDNRSSVGALSAITVFDRDSGSVHVQKKNTVWFRPFGLDIPDELAETCQAIKAKFEVEENSLVAQRNSVFLNPTWSAETTFGKVLGDLKAETDLAPLRALPAFSEQDDKTLSQLTIDLAQDGSVAAAIQMRRAQDLDRAITVIEAVNKECSDESLLRVLSLSSTANTLRKTATTAASAAFDNMELSGVGEEVWQNLWESARTYSDSLGDEGPGFPPSVSGTCVLCQQPIQSTAAERMGKFESFIKGDTEAKAQEAEQQFSNALNQFSGQEFHISQISSAYRVLQESRPEIAKNLLKFFAMAKLRKQQLLKAIAGENAPSLTPLPEAPVDACKSVSADLKTYAASLQASKEGAERMILEKQKDELTDRKQSDVLIKIAETEIERLKRLALIQKCKADTDTRAITRLGNAIADDVMTPRMRDRFQQEIVALGGNRIRVEVVRSGGSFGSPKYEIKLFASQKAKVHDILSEGEQTCVALASYLTELANTSHSSALVFDDPVTSLDHRWRANVAKRLVEEASVRQIIIFTHDMIFVNDLHSRATKKGLSVGISHLSRSGDAVGYVNEDLPWRASGVKQRVDELQKAARVARSHYEEKDDEKYREAVSKLYSDLRSTWERALEDIVFQDVIKRHRDYINTKGLKGVTALEETDVEVFSKNFSKCSDFLDGHDPSRGHDIEPPEPDELDTDIATLDSWSRALRTKMGAVK